MTLTKKGMISTNSMKNLKFLFKKEYVLLSCKVSFKWNCILSMFIKLNIAERKAAMVRRKESGLKGLAASVLTQA